MDAPPSEKKARLDEHQDQVSVVPMLRVIKHDPDADVSFVFPNDDGAMILVKKSRLIELNEVFEKQFTSGIQSNQVTVTDISVETFNSVIKHIYGIENDVIVKRENFLEILYVSRKYFLDAWTVAVVNFVKKALSTTTTTPYYMAKADAIDLKSYDFLVEYYEELEKFDVELLNEVIRLTCINYPIPIIQKLSIQSSAHMRLLKIILNSQILDCSEYSLYEAIMEMMKKTKGNLTWNEVKRNFGNLLYLIRFPTMTVEQLVKCRRPPCFLAPNQIVDFLGWAQDKEFTASLLRFSIIPRINSDTTFTNGNTSGCSNGHTALRCTRCKTDVDKFTLYDLLRKLNQ